MAPLSVEKISTSWSSSFQNLKVSVALFLCKIYALLGMTGSTEKQMHNLNALLQVCEWNYLQYICGSNLFLQQPQIPLSHLPLWKGFLPVSSLGHFHTTGKRRMDRHYRNKQVSGYSTREQRKTSKNSKNGNALIKMLKKLPRKSQQITTFLSKNKEVSQPGRAMATIQKATYSMKSLQYSRTHGCITCR